MINSKCVQINGHIFGYNLGHVYLTVRPNACLYKRWKLGVLKNQQTKKDIKGLDSEVMESIHDRWQRDFLNSV